MVPPQVEFLHGGEPILLLSQYIMCSLLLTCSGRMGACSVSESKVSETVSVLRHGRQSPVDPRSGMT